MDLLQEERPDIGNQPSWDCCHVICSTEEDCRISINKPRRRCGPRATRMNSGDYRATALLTEHLGFAPLSLIDEVINSVNQIMYNCTDALETFLLKRRGSQLQQLSAHSSERDKSVEDEETRKLEKEGKLFPLDEIHAGTAELETLLVSHVDKNFDKFELYTLRNILTIPKDLVEGGWIRLKHHEHLDFSRLSGELQEPKTSIRTLVDNIAMELQLRKILRLQLAKAKKLLALLSKHRQSVEAVISANANSQLTPEIISMMKDSLEPLNENIYYLFGQVDTLVQQVFRLSDKLKADQSLEDIRQAKLGPSNRDIYIREKSLKILEEIGVVRSGNTYSPQ